MELEPITLTLYGVLNITSGGTFEIMKTLLYRNNVPVRELESIGRIFDHALQSMGNPIERPSHRFPVDLAETDAQLLVTASTPGFTAENLSITVDKGVLTIKGERAEATPSEGVRYLHREIRTGAFERQINLPDNLDLENIQAQFKDGILTVVISKLPEAQPKTIKIEVVTPN